MRTIAALAICIAVAACAPMLPKPRYVQIGVPFDLADARARLSAGVGEVHGSAFLRQRGGGVVTCAGAPVSLYPATPYAQRYFAIFYGSGPGPAQRTDEYIAVEDMAPAFESVRRKSTCDAQGNFSFDRVADGAYFVETTVTWMAGNSRQGGPVMMRVTVDGLAPTKVVLAP